MITTGRVPRAMLDARHLNESPREWCFGLWCWATRDDVVAGAVDVAIAPRSAFGAGHETRAIMRSVAPAATSTAARRRGAVRGRRYPRRGLFCAV